MPPIPPPAGAAGVSFAGTYDFDSGDDFGRPFESFLRHLPEGGLFMCHPGFVDAEPREHDRLTDRRETEFAGRG